MIRHEWKPSEASGTYCARCGIIRNVEGANTPCVRKTERLGNTPEELREMAAEVRADHYDRLDERWTRACTTHTDAMHRALLAGADEIERLWCRFIEADSGWAKAEKEIVLLQAEAKALESSFADGYAAALEEAAAIAGQIARDERLVADLGLNAASEIEEEIRALMKEHQ